MLGVESENKRMWFPAYFLSCEVEMKLRVKSEDLKEVQKPGEGIETS